MTIRLTRLGVLSVFGAALSAQTIPVVLDVEVENAVRYMADVTDPAKLAINTTATAPVATRAFTDSIFIGDIVSVNGRPAKGLWTSRQYAVGFSPAPAAGSAIADVYQGAIAECKYEILNAAGQVIGRMMDGGLFPHAISGGTGSFIGAKGEQATTAARVVKAVRVASMAEDPANRRVNGGGNVRILLRFIPATRPEVVATANGPAVIHSDGKLVSAANPAQAGEMLTLYATGLGPTTPAVDFGQPFPANTAYAANAPVEVLINGQPSEVTYAGGYGGAIDGYQVNFRLPAGLSPGAAVLQLTAAWIPGAETRISVK
jgi:uncharacterized protein (TIGR03437 family)